MQDGSFAAWLRTARRKARLTQAQLAERLFVGPLTVSRWESGKQTPPESRQRLVRDILEAGSEPETVSEGPAPYEDRSVLVRLSPDELKIIRIYRRLVSESDESA